jgi:hypothetical protein
MSMTETIETIENLENISNIDKKTSGNSLNSNSSAKTEDSEKEKEKENNKLTEKIKKKVTFTKPVYTIIDVESYKKLNEDISETRFYYSPEPKINNIKKKRMNCGCKIF